MAKKYRITCKTDPYHASGCAKHMGREILQRDGATPVRWVHDDHFGQGFTLNEARHILMRIAYEDTVKSYERIHHRFFSMHYEADVLTYAIEEF